MPRSLIYICLILALLYVLFPRDLVPDFLVGWGWIDDAVILFLLWRFYRRQRELRQTGGRPDRNQQTSHQNRQAGDNRQQRSADAGDRGRRSPYAVLEIEPGASQNEIKSAYRRLAAQYHPDKVQHLGKDLQELAETRFKEIQQAYDFLTRTQTIFF